MARSLPVVVVVRALTAAFTVASHVRLYHVGRCLGACQLVSGLYKTGCLHIQQPLTVAALGSDVGGGFINQMAVGVAFEWVHEVKLTRGTLPMATDWSVATPSRLVQTRGRVECLTKSQYACNEHKYKRSGHHSAYAADSIAGRFVSGFASG